MKKTEYSNILNDNTPCFEIDTSGTASEHDLADLASIAGHSSLTSCLNHMKAWSMTVAQVAEILISRPEDFSGTVADCDLY